MISQEVLSWQMNEKEHSTADPYWDDASVALLSAEIALALMTKEASTFSDVLDIHFSLKITEDGSGISTSLDPVFSKIRMKSPDCFAINQWKTFCEAAARTARSIYVLMNPTLMVFTKNIKQSMRTRPSIDFDKVANEKSIIFLTTSPVNKALHSLANIFVARAIAEFTGWRLCIHLELLLFRSILPSMTLLQGQKSQICRRKWRSPERWA